MPAMQHQKEQDQQQQQQKKKGKNKQQVQHDADIQKSAEIEDPEVLALKMQMSSIANTITQTHGSAQAMIEKQEHKEHKRICPTCGRLSDQCLVDQDRIASGIIMLCGCSVCGGLK